jgi:hypothetical protein
MHYDHMHYEKVYCNDSGHPHYQIPRLVTPFSLFFVFLGLIRVAARIVFGATPSYLSRTVLHDDCPIVSQHALGLLTKY